VSTTSRKIAKAEKKTTLARAEAPCLKSGGGLYCINKYQEAANNSQLIEVNKFDIQRRVEKFKQRDAEQGAKHSNTQVLRVSHFATPTKLCARCLDLSMCRHS
jgi:hypothetical protein